MEWRNTGRPRYKESVETVHCSLQNTAGLYIIIILNVKVQTVCTAVWTVALQYCYIIVIIIIIIIIIIILTFRMSR
jgi:hypothetical protein